MSVLTIGLNVGMKNKTYYEKSDFNFDSIPNYDIQPNENGNGSENQELQDILTLEKIDYCKYPCAKSAGCFADLINFLQLLSLLP